MMALPRSVIYACRISSTSFSSCSYPSISLQILTSFIEAITDYYAWIKNTNTEAKSVFEVLSKFTSTGVQLVEGSLACANTFGNASTTNTTNAIAASAAYDMVVGGFTADGYNGYLAVNVDFPDTDGTRTNAVTFTLGTQYSKAIVYVDGVATVVRVAKDGTLNLNIGCGEGVFIVPIA